MKTHLLSLSCIVSLLFAVGVHAQVSDQTAEQVEDSTIWGQIDQMPAFPGGEQAILQYLNNNIVYPKEALENGAEGQTICEFIIDTDGSIQDVTIYRPSCNRHLDKEAVRVVKRMPKWQPAMKDGRPVRVSCQLPIDFNLDSAKGLKRKETNAAKVLQDYLDKNFIYPPFKNGFDDVYSIDISIPLSIIIDSAGVIYPISLGGMVKCTNKMVTGRYTKEMNRNGSVIKISSTYFEDNKEIKKNVDDYCNELKIALDEFIQTMNDAHIVCTPTKINKKSVEQSKIVYLQRDGLKKYKTKKQKHAK